MKELKISVAITIFNEEKTISLMLDALVNQSRVIDEVIFCDGGSTDNTKEIILEYSEKGFPIKIVPRKGKCRGAGRNSAITATKNEYVALIDGGSVPKKDWMLSLVQCLEKNTEAEVIFGSVEPNIDTRIERSIGALITGKTQSPGSVTPTVSSLLITKSIWKKIDGFPESNSGKYIVEDLIFLDLLKKESSNTASANEAIVLWYLGLDVKKAYRRYVTYSAAGMVAGLAKTWQYGTFRYLSVHFLIILLAYFNNTLILLFSVLLQFLKVHSYLVRVPWYKESRSLEKFYDLLYSFFIFFIIDIATIHGFLRWVVVDKISYKK